MGNQVERNRRYRESQRIKADVLQSENEKLRAEVEQLRATSKSTPAPEASHGGAMERRLRELEQMVQGLDRRLDQIESMTHGAY